MYRFARGTIFSARTFVPSTSGTQPVSSNISEASSTSSAISSLVVSLTMICSSDELGRNVAATTLVCPANATFPKRLLRDYADKVASPPPLGEEQIETALIGSDGV